MTSIDNDIFVKVRFLYPSLSKSEKAVADILLDEGENVTNYTIAEYAEKAGCSDASILRFCRRLGVEGLSLIHIWMRKAFCFPSSPTAGNAPFVWGRKQCIKGRTESLRAARTMRPQPNRQRKTH